MTNEIKPHKVLSPSQILDSLDAIRDVQSEVICHVQTWLHDPRPEVDERFNAARQREAEMLERVMAFDRRTWNKGRPPDTKASLKAEADAKRRRLRAEQQARYRARQEAEAQPEGEGL